MLIFLLFNATIDKTTIEKSISMSINDLWKHPQKNIFWWEILHLLCIRMSPLYHFILVYFSIEAKMLFKLCGNLNTFVWWRENLQGWKIFFFMHVVGTKKSSGKLCEFSQWKFNIQSCSSDKLCTSSIGWFSTLHFTLLHIYLFFEVGLLLKICFHCSLEIPRSCTFYSFVARVWLLFSGTW